MSAPQLSLAKTNTALPTVAGLDRGARILARTFYKDLRENGYTPNQILALSTELIELITQEMREARDENETIS